jgi:exodeoxyribonuclease VII large subunit
MATFFGFMVRMGVRLDGLRQPGRWLEIGGEVAATRHAGKSFSRGISTNPIPSCRDFSLAVGGRRRQPAGVDLFSMRPQPAAAPKALSVTQLVRRMKNLLEVQLGEVWVEGEVSNLRKQGSGHWYFSLKDEGAQIQCVMFGAGRKPGAEVVRDGALVRVFAEASVYEARGQLQIIVAKAEQAGLGELQARFEALKRKLQAEGLFKPARKRPLPGFPAVVGIVTSDTGAAIRDILNVLQRRAPWVQPVLLPVRVQGRGAEVEIAEAVRKLGRAAEFGFPRCDVLIVGRGGGSLEDLWCFNEEVVARAIAACPVPVIAAVGHEIDFTIADFVADVRAPTPSAAAELAVPDGEELLARMAQHRRRLARVLEQSLLRSQARLDGLKRGVLQRDGEKLLREPALRLDSLRGRLIQAVGRAVAAAAAEHAGLRLRHQAQHPAKVLERRLEHVATQRQRLAKVVEDALERQRVKLAHAGTILRALGPESAFQRGFSLTLGPDGKALRSVAGLAPGARLRTKVSDGEVTSEVLDVNAESR